MNKLLNKFIAALLVITLAGANLSLLGMYGISYALTNEQLAGQTTQTQNSNVEFNAYFEDGGHIKTEDISSTTAKLYVNVKVKNAGYLKNGIIQFEDVNFKLGEVNNENIQSIDDNKITLKQLNNGSNVTIEIPISILRNDYVSLDYFSKETKTKFSGTYIDGNGNQKSVSKDIVNKLSWESEATGVVTRQLTKYIPYIVGTKYGVMVQTKVNSGIVDSKLPVKKTELEVEVPEIGGTKPTQVAVVALNTKATTGETNGLHFTEENYSYNAETGIVKITVENTSDKIAWLKNAQDEYLVTYIFEGQEMYNNANTNGIDTVVSTSAKITVYGCEETTVLVQKESINIQRTEGVGTIADFGVNITNQISKGQIYANYDSQNKKEILYFEKYTSTVSSKDLTDTITFRQGIDKFITTENEERPTTVSGNNYTYNKAVVVDVDVFRKMLGEEGTIDIYKTDNTKIGTINKTTLVQDNKYILDIKEEDTNQIYMITSKPLTEGRIEITIEKAIKANIGYDKTEMKSFTRMETNLQGEASISTVNFKSQSLLQEPKSVAKLTISKKDLTTVVKNENVVIRAILDTSDVNNALYKNPTLKITLPSHINKVDIKNHDILMANGLTIQGEPQVITESGKQVIQVTLTGTQEEYTIGAEYEGTIIYLNTDLTVKPLTPTNPDNMQMKFTNANEVLSQHEGTVQEPVNFVAPIGVVAVNEISNYAQGKKVTSITDGNFTGKIATYSEKRTATVYGKVQNNNENKIDNVVILGRFPVKDNKKIDSEESLGSTFNTTLKTAVDVEGIDASKYIVYYSENINAQTDLLNTNNGWITTATEAAKSYMIVITGHEIAPGEAVEFSYDVEIPANLKHNNSVSEMYKVYYRNLSEIGEIQEAKTSAIMTMSTGQGPELEVELTSTASIVREGQIVKMKALVKNTGAVTAENIKVNVPLPENAKFMEALNASGFITETETTKILDVGTLKPGETKQVSYYIRFDNHVLNNLGEQYPKEIMHQVTVTADDLTGQIPSNQYTFSVQQGKIALSMIGDIKESQVCKKGEIIDYKIDLENISEGDLNNTVLTIQLPQGVKYKSAKIREKWSSIEYTTEGITYDEQTNTVTIQIELLKTKKAIELSVELEEFEGPITILSKVTADGTEEHYSNITEYMLEIIDLEVSELTSTPRYVKEGENITYQLELTNKGKSAVYGINIKDILPEELTFVEVTYTYNEQEQSATNSINGELNLSISGLNAGETTRIKIIAKAGILPDKNDKEIQNKVTITANNYEGATTNTVTNIIEYNQRLRDELENQENGTTTPVEPTEERYKISGTAWLDENKDGKRNEEEPLLSNIPVLLLNKEDNTIVKDVDTNESKRATTGDNGTYQFTNLKPGNYIVIFLYDAARYSVTVYQERDVDEGLNSDAIDINITVDGKRTIAGTSDALTISDKNVRDIDIGLYVAEKFDLKLDKYISKITRTTPTNGTKVYEYNNSKAAKIEVLGSNVGKSSTVIEYKIVVTNEGAIAGYAKKIVDYLPKGVGFSTDLNKDWYLSDNGNIYNASLANELIKPGESKELTLVVTKKITEDSLGNPINNNAEIYESYNDQGLKDIDSIQANKAQDEDDMSQADVIFSIVTGKIIMYTTIVFGVVAILGFGIFEIKKRVLNKKKN